MNESVWVAVSALALAVLVQFGSGLFHLGRHAQRLAALEEKTKDIGTLAVLNAALAEMKLQITEIRQDVKNLLTGRIRPASRREPET
ncbi:MAG TPA: hypothetical protein VL358_01110 [Caulobacteraceae bacterium]|nr:hypothetical protein [Caulobacteraceae bacterium]